MSEDRIECPSCGGRGSGYSIVCGERNGRRFSESRVTDCSVCKGAGIITPEKAAAIAEGERRREDRLGRGLSQREEAARLGMDVALLSKIENGRVW